MPDRPWITDMKIGLMSRLASLRPTPDNAEKRRSAGSRLPPLAPKRTAKWLWEEDIPPDQKSGHGFGYRPGRWPWPRAALVIGFLSLVFWIVIALLVVHFTR